MKKIGKRLTLVLLAFMSAIMVFTGVMSIGTGRFAVAEPTENQTYEYSSEWYRLSFSRDHLDFLLNGNFRSYLELSAGDVGKLKDELVAAAEEIIVKSILDNTAKDAAGGNGAASGVSAMALDIDFDLPEDLPEYTPDEVWGNEGLLNQFRDYIEERLSDPAEMDKYLSGGYDLLVDYAISSYIESKGEASEEQLQEYYGKIEHAMNDVVDKSLQNIVDELEENGATEEEIQEWRDKKQTAEEKVAERVQTVKDNGGVANITIKDVMGVLDEIYIDGIKAYEAGYGVKVSALKEIIKKFAVRPGEIANMSKEELSRLFQARIYIVTEYGDIDFDVRFGFFGDVSLIKKAASAVAKIFDVSVDGNKVAVNISAPEFVSDALLKIANTSKVPDRIKHGVFALFGNTVEGVFDKAKDITYEELLGYIKEVDFQKVFASFINADFINSYFGNYIEQLLGHKLTQENIDKIINKLADKAQSLAAKKWDSNDALDFLRENVPGFDRIYSKLPQDKINAALDKLLANVNRIDWEKYHADGIREMLENSDTLNNKINSYLEETEIFGDLYAKFVEYAEKLFEYVPASVKDGKIINLYNGDTQWAFDGVYTVNVSKIVDKAVSVLQNRGFDRLAEIMDQAKTLFDQSEYTVDLSVKATLPEVYGAKYVVNGETVAEGVLPAGADVAYFADLTEIDGVKILYWVAENGADTDYKTAVEKMPSADTAFVPVTDFTLETNIDGENVLSIDRPYEKGVTNALNVTAKGVPYAEYSYEWYKAGDGTAEKLDCTESSLTVSEVKDSGRYYAVVTDILTGISHSTEETEISFDVAITPIEVTVDCSLVMSADKYVYNGEVQTVEWKKEVLSPEGAAFDDLLEVISEENLSATDAGTYTAKLTIALKDPDNYTLNDELNDETEYEDQWTIEKVSINLSEYEWASDTDHDGDFVFEYTGSDITLYIRYKGTRTDYTDKLDITYGGDYVKKEIGSYTATVTVTVKAQYEKNYEIEEGSEISEKEWSIVDSHIVDITGAEWTINGTKLSEGASLQLTYNGNKIIIGIDFSGVSGGIDAATQSTIESWITIKSNGAVVTSIKNAGTYTVSLVKPNDSELNVTGLPLDIQITVDPKPLDITVELDNTSFVYDGEEHTVNVVIKLDGNVIQSDARFDVDYTGTLSESAVGVYTVNVTITFNDDNYTTANKTLTLTWKIVSESYVAGDTEYTSDDTDTPEVKVKVPGEVVPTDAEAVFGKKTNLDEYKDKIGEQVGDVGWKLGTAYDVHFNDRDGNEMTFPAGTKFKVSVLIPEELRGYPDNRLLVIHVTDDGEVEIIDGATRDGNYMVFETDGFSIYAVIGVELPVSDLYLWIVIVCSLITLLIVIAFILIVLLHRKGGDGEPAPADDASETTAETTAAAETVTPIVAPPAPRMVTRYDRSFKARLTQADKTLKNIYNELKNYVLSYKDVHNRMSWNFDSFNKGRNKIAKLQLKGKTLYMYVALDPKELPSKYYHKDVSDVARYAAVPTKLKVKSPRSLKYAKEMIDLVMKNLGIAQGEIGKNDYTFAYASTNKLVENGEIKVKKVPARIPVARDNAANAEVKDNTANAEVKDNTVNAEVNESTANAENTENAVNAENKDDTVNTENKDNE